MRSLASLMVRTGAIRVMALIVSLVLIGCDSNPGGPSAPTRPPSPGVLTSPVAADSATKGKTVAKKKLNKRLVPQPDRHASFE